MEIQLGADVMGTDGKLGELEKVIAEARTDCITQIVVKHGGLRSRLYTLPLGRVQRVEDGTIYLDLNEAALTGGEGYADAIHAPDVDYVGPPSQDHEGTHQGNLDFDSVVASGAQMGGKPMGYPGGERLTPDMRDQPAISLGMDIIATDGSKVGEVAEMSFTVADGRVARIVLKRPLIARRDPHAELPVAWVKDLAVDGILLNVAKSQVDALLEAAATEG
jgi:sporulation protein YlmC with PRC-barrel domain